MSRAHASNLAEVAYSVLPADAPIAGASAWAVTRNGTALRTPAGHPLTLPTQALAEAVAAEWRALPRLPSGAARYQHLPLTVLANAAQDQLHAGEGRARAEAELMGYLDTDLICYPAASPESLAAYQQVQWEGPRAWIAQQYACTVTTTTGLMPIPQPAATHAALRARLAVLDPYRLAGLVQAVHLCGSLLLGLCLLDGHLDAAAAHRAACADADWQMQQWGADPETQQRQAMALQELAHVGHWLALLGGAPAPHAPVPDTVEATP